MHFIKEGMIGKDPKDVNVNIAHYYNKCDKCIGTHTWLINACR